MNIQHSTTYCICTRLAVELYWRKLKQINYIFLPYFGIHKTMFVMFSIVLHCIFLYTWNMKQNEATKKKVNEKNFLTICIAAAQCFVKQRKKKVIRGREQIEEMYCIFFILLKIFFMKKQKRRKKILKMTLTCTTINYVVLCCVVQLTQHSQKIQNEGWDFHIFQLEIVSWLVFKLSVYTFVFLFLFTGNHVKNLCEAILSRYICFFINIKSSFRLICSLSILFIFFFADGAMLYIERKYIG